MKGITTHSTGAVMSWPFIGARVPLRKSTSAKRSLNKYLSYAAIRNKLTTNLACPAASLLSNLFTGPFLIMFTASTP